MSTNGGPLPRAQNVMFTSPLVVANWIAGSINVDGAPRFLAFGSLSGSFPIGNGQNTNQSSSQLARRIR